MSVSNSYPANARLRVAVQFAVDVQQRNYSVPLDVNVVDCAEIPIIDFKVLLDSGGSINCEYAVHGCVHKVLISHI